MKIISSLKAAFLLIRNTKTFYPQKVFSGKRVAVIGAANTPFEEGNGTYIDDFDLVVRVNKAVHVMKSEDAPFLGKKTDVLFHSFYENEYSGGGPIDRELFSTRGVKYLVNPYRNLKGFIVHLNFYKRHLAAEKTFFLDSPNYRLLDKEMNSWTPTVGMASLSSILNSNCAEVFITGFTFFKTPYALGYRDHLRSSEENSAHIKKQGLHNPDLEFEIFQDLLKKTKCKKVILDKALTSIIAS